jgi:hypothetical protein
MLLRDGVLRQSSGQRGGDLLQSIAPEVTFSGEIRQALRQLQFVLAWWQ